MLVGVSPWQNHSALSGPGRTTLCRGMVMTFRCCPASLSEVSLWGGRGCSGNSGGLCPSLAPRTGARPLPRCRLPRGAGRMKEEKGAKEFLHGANAASRPRDSRKEPGPAGKAKPTGAGQAAVAGTAGVWGTGGRAMPCHAMVVPSLTLSPPHRPTAGVAPWLGKGRVPAEVSCEQCPAGVPAEGSCVQ